MTPCRARRSDERGAVAIMVAARAVMLFVIAALVVDLGSGPRHHAASPRTPRTPRRWPPPTCSTRRPATARPRSGATALLRRRGRRRQGVRRRQLRRGRGRLGATARRRRAAPPARRQRNTCISFDSRQPPTQVRVRMPDPRRRHRARSGWRASTPSRSARPPARSSRAARRYVRPVLPRRRSTPATPTSRCRPGGIMVNGNLTAGPNSTWTAGTSRSASSAPSTVVSSRPP